MKILVYDYETIRGCFLAGFFFPEENKYIYFVINQYKNDLYSFVKFLENHKDFTFVGFNNLNFDAQVTEYIFDNHQKWEDLTNIEISTLISDFGSKIIDDQKYGLFPPYKEEYLQFKQLDVPKILHWFNENKRVSLKQAEFELRAENIENFEVEVSKLEFSEKEIEDLIFYCFNDIKYTYEILKYVEGNVEHPLYKGKNKIYDRQVVISEVGLKCINWDDVKIGSEWNKMDYCNATGKKPNDLRPKSVETIYGKKFKRFFPPTLKFTSEPLIKFINDLGNTTVLPEKQEFNYQFSPTLLVSVAKGGLHSREIPRLLKPKEDEIFLQCDKGSQYPDAIYRFGIYPKHLGEEWNKMIPTKVKRRIDNKMQYKKTKDPKFNSLQEMGKLQLNGGLFGGLGLKGGWQEDQIGLLKTTLGCEIEILMVVEALNNKAFNITSVNTDGFDIILKRDRLDEFFDIIQDCENTTGNKEMGIFEFTEFEWMVQTSVNDYIASKKGVYEKRIFYEDKIAQKGSKYPHLKTKGDFSIDFELHKNSSFRIIPLALLSYFDSGKDVSEFINQHDDIFDFCARSSSGQTYIHEYTEGKEIIKLPKLIRYYVSKEGKMIRKIVKKEITTGANDQNVKPAELPKKVCNRLPKNDYQIHLKNVNRQWYIEKALETIAKVELGKKRLNKTRIDKNQISLF